jgi:hypothetical protein
MSKPLIVSIPHRLGKDEAVRRLKSGLGHIRTSFAGVMHVAEETWHDNRLDFRVAVLGQGASGTIEVLDDHVRMEVQLPWVLAQLAARGRALIQKQGHLLLDKK